MKNRFTIVLALLIGAVFCGVAWFWNESPRTAASLPSFLTASHDGEYDFGRSLQQKELEHVFKLENKANVPLKIVGIRSSCGCTWAPGMEELVGRELSSGEKLDFPVRLKTGSMQNNANGRILLDYYPLKDGECEEPKQLLALQVHTKIIQDYRIEPQRVHFGRVDGLTTETVTERFRIVPDAKPDLHILDVSSQTPGLSAALLPRNGDEPYEIEVTLDFRDLTQSRRVDGYVTVTTDSPNLSKTLVNVWADYRAPFETDPQMLVVSSSENGKVTREVVVSTSCPSEIA